MTNCQVEISCKMIENEQMKFSCIFCTSIFQIRVLFTLFYLQLLLFQISDSDLRLQFKFLICEFTTLLGVDIDGVWAAP